MTRSLPKAVADFSKQLAASVSIGGTTATLNNALDADGNQLTNNKIYGFTIDTGSRKEYIIGLLTGDDELSQIVSVSRQGVATSGFTIAHNVGANVQITDWALLSRVVNLLDGTTGWDSGVPIKYDGAPAQTDPLALATVQFVLDTASGTTVLAFNPQTVDGVVGENVTDGDWVYFKESDGKWWKTDADDSTKSVNVRIGKVRATTLADAAVTGGIFISGSENIGTYVTGTTYYLSNTAGALGTSAGTNSVEVGVGDANGDLIMTHVFPVEVTADQVAALAGGGDLGTPSTTNKYQTEEGVVKTQKFAGTGADGALLITSGTTTIDLGGVAQFIKNYTSITISGTGKLAFSNPHAGGTIIILKSQGDVEITSSGSPAIDIREMGAISTQNGILIGGGQEGGSASGSAAGSGGSALTGQAFYTVSSDQLYRKALYLLPGVKGGTGGQGFNVDGGTGGLGAGALLIQCGGSLNFTGTINASGSNGSDGGGLNGGAGAGGGGGGSAGMVVILYNELTANSGTITTTGGNGGTGGAGTDGDGTAGGGGGGAGSVQGAGANGGAAGVAGQNAGTDGVGGGGGGGRDGAGAGFAGGVGGDTMGGLVAKNVDF